MPEYRLNLSDEDPEEVTRQKTLREIHAFIESMNNRALAVATLNEEQSQLWDEEGDVDYQDEFGRQIIQQLGNDGSETLLIRSEEGLPLALASRGEQGWQGLGIDKRLRPEIASLLQSSETEFE